MALGPESNYFQQFLGKTRCIDSKYNAVENSRNESTVKRNNSKQVFEEAATT